MTVKCSVCCVYFRRFLLGLRAAMRVKCSVCCVYLRRFVLGLRAAMRVDCSVGLPSSFLVRFESCHDCEVLSLLCLPSSFLVRFESCHCWDLELP